MKTAELEIGFRGLDVDYKECLKDTIRSCLSIMSKGTIFKEDYKFYLAGIRKIRGHIIGYKYNPDIAVDQAAKTLYLYSCLLSESTFRRDINVTEYKTITKLPDELKSLFYLKRFNATAFAYLCESMKVVNLEELIQVLLTVS